MRFMLIRKAAENTERGDMPTEELFAAMGAYNAQLIAAGAMLDGAGLKPSSFGARVQIDGVGGKPPAVVDGPFAEVKELVAGFTVINVRDKAEALEWAKKWPPEDGPVEIEVRQFYEMEDFGDTPATRKIRDDFAKLG
jgi:hypothetical protein